MITWDLPASVPVWLVAPAETWDAALKQLRSLATVVGLSVSFGPFAFGCSERPKRTLGPRLRSLPQRLRGMDRQLRELLAYRPGQRL